MTLPTSFPLQVAGGKTIPIASVGFGTWAAGDKSWAKDAVLAALKAGYRHLDCAWMYGVDEQVGEAIRESGIPRKEIFVTSKFWPHFAAPENVEICLDRILKNMGLDYIDLFLAHWPVAFQAASRSALEKSDLTKDSSDAGKGMVVDDDGNGSKIDWEHTSKPIAEGAGQKGSWVSTWQALEKLVATGKTKAVGVSNFSIADLKEILPHVKDVPISCNQVEVHPWLPQTELIDFMKQHKIICTCYSPLAGQKTDGKTLMKDETVVELAKKNDMDVGQLLQSWAVQRGTIPLAKSQTESRIKTNLTIKELSTEDMKALDGLAQPGDSGRTVDMRDNWGVKNLFKN